jgi:putative tryptophan/tyrosine transport system substrate-binding protein
MNQKQNASGLLQPLRRRDLIAFAAAAVATPTAAFAQRSQDSRRLGILMFSSEAAKSAVDYLITPLITRLNDLGWRDGDNLHIEYRWANGERDRFGTLAEELAASVPDVIVGISPPAVEALKRATPTIPIVFFQVGDPIAYGFVESLSRPGRNITGFTNFEFPMGGKWIEMLEEVAPNLTRAIILSDPLGAPGYEGYMRAVEAGARAISIETVSAPVHDESEIELVMADAAKIPNTGIVTVPVVGAAETYRRQIVNLAARYKLPAIYSLRGFATEGGLIYYGVNASDQARGVAGYVDRILKGEKPADLPVQGPTKFELVINMKTAKALGITIPPTLLVSADEVIE